MTYRKIYCEVFSHCNNECLNCPLAEDFKYGNEIFSASALKTALNAIDSEPKDIIEISGGEPTLHPDFLNILYTIKMNFPGKITLLTNAETLSEMKYAEKVASMVTDVVITLYSPDRVVHDNITRSKGSFERKIEGIKNMKNNGAKIHIKTLIMKQTYNQLPALLSYCISNFGDDIHFNINSLHMANRAWDYRDKIAIRFTDASPYIEETLELAKKHNVITSIFMPMCMIDPYFWSYFPVGFGEIVRKYISITPDGNIDNAVALLNEFSKKPNKCNKCYLKDRCYWPWEGYIKYYGDEELVPNPFFKGGE